MGEKKRLLVERYFDFYALALSMLHDEDDAKDVVQEALTRTLARLGVRNPVAYCFQAVRRNAIDTIRRRMRVTTLDGLESGTDPEREALTRRLAAVRDNLPDSLGTLVELHYDDGYTHGEIAAMTGLSKSTVRRRLNEALGMIRKEIL